MSSSCGTLSGSSGTLMKNDSASAKINHYGLFAQNFSP